MIKRPLCLAAVLFLGIQIIFMGGTRKAEAESSSLLEKSIRDGESVFAEGTVVRREESADVSDVISDGCSSPS